MKKIIHSIIQLLVISMLWQPVATFAQEAAVNAAPAVASTTDSEKWTNRYILMGLIATSVALHFGASDAIRACMMISPYNDFGDMPMNKKVLSFLAEGQYYRLFSGAFLHGSLLHLASNSYYIYSLIKDDRWEKIITAPQLLALITLSAAGFSDFITGPSVGISGICMALESFSLLSGSENKEQQYNYALVMMLQSLYFDINFNLGGSNISWLGHAFGCLKGMAFHKATQG